MAFFENCVERATALAATCGWLALGGGTEAAVGVAIGGAGLAAVMTEAVRRHGPESENAIRKIREKVRTDLLTHAIAERWDISDELALADAALERALVGCFLDRKSLASAARSPAGFPGAATELILSKLAEREPETFGPLGSEVSVKYAKTVIGVSLEAAIENESYFKALEPILIFEILKGLGSIDENLVQISRDIGIIRDQDVAMAIEEALLSIKSMPGKLNEIVSNGGTSVSFDEAHGALVKLYALGRSRNRLEIVTGVEEFQSVYNGYLDAIRGASAGRLTLDEVNRYFDDQLVARFVMLFKPAMP